MFSLCHWVSIHTLGVVDNFVCVQWDSATFMGFQDWLASVSQSSYYATYAIGSLQVSFFFFRVNPTSVSYVSYFSHCFLHLGSSIALVYTCGGSSVTSLQTKPMASIYASWHWFYAHAKGSPSDSSSLCFK